LIVFPAETSHHRQHIIAAQVSGSNL